MDLSHGLMMEDSDKCRGCTIAPSICSITDKSICPCFECLIKVMCLRACDEWKELSSGWKKVNGQWFIR